MSIFIRNHESKGIRNWSLKQYTEEQKKGETERYGTVIPLETKLLDRHARDSYEFRAGVVCELYAKSTQREKGPSGLVSEAVEDRLVNYGRGGDGKLLDSNALKQSRDELFVSIGARVTGLGGAGKSKSYMCFDNVLLGEGANHRAHYGLSATGDRVAIVSPSREGEMVIADELLQIHEGSRMSPNVLQLHRADGERAVYELAQGDLQAMLHRPGAMVARWMYESLKGALQVTEQGIIHLDLKLDNVFVMEDGTAKIGDLELFASFVPGGTNYGYFGRGNFAHYSPERREYVLDLEDGGEVSEKDTTWGMMHLFCDADLHTAGSANADPDFQLSPEFRNRFKQYRKVIANAYEAGEKKYPTDKKAARQYAHEQVLNYLNGLPTDSKGRVHLFGGLEGKTALDDVVYRMAFVNPEERISLEDVVRLFEIKMMTCDIKRRPVYLTPAMKVEDTIFFSKPKKSSK